MRVRLTRKDLVKVFFGGRVLISSDIYDRVNEIKLGKSSYITK